MRRLFALALLVAGCTTAAAPGSPPSGGPRISNMRFEGLRVVEGIYVPSAEFGRDYTILVDFESEAPIARVLLQTRFDDGRAGPILERSFQVIPPGALKGTLVFASRILADRRARTTEWWVEDTRGRASNKLVQRVVIRD